MALKIVKPPEKEPVTLEEAKSHCKIFITDDDALITAYIKAAREWAEHTGTRRAFITQVWNLTLDEFPEWEIIIPRPPLQSTDFSIKYKDINGAEQTLDASKYIIDTQSEPGRITPAYGESWPSTQNIINAVTITFKAGYGDSESSVPRDIWHAILFLVAHAYENRQPVGDIGKEIPFGVNALLSSHRIFGGTIEDE